MPKRTDISSILVIGAGPIVIGQACEFDYSGTQACKALKEEGYRVILVNSNPASIMTDPEVADATYVEPITAEVVEKIIAVERPDAILPTMGGQTGLNMALTMAHTGVLKKYGVEILEGYGLSETSPVASFNQLDKPRKAGSIGYPVWGVELTILDDKDQPVADGDRGEICIRGHNIMKGYLKRPDATKEALRVGWFHRGDIGIRD